MTKVKILSAHDENSKFKLYIKEDEDISLCTELTYRKHEGNVSLITKKVYTNKFADLRHLGRFSRIDGHVFMAEVLIPYYVRDSDKLQSHGYIELTFPGYSDARVYIQIDKDKFCMTEKYGDGYTTAETHYPFIDSQALEYTKSVLCHVPGYRFPVQRVLSD